MEPMEKMAAWGQFRKALPGVVGEHMVGAAVQGAMGLGLAAAGMGAMHLFSAATKTRDFKKMLEYNPDLSEHHASDPKVFNQMYTSLRHMNPTYASDPLVAGNFMRNMVNSPNNAGEFLTTAMSGREKAPLEEAMLAGIKKGPMAASKFMKVKKPLVLMDKVSTFLGDSAEFGPLAVPLFTREFEKIASEARLLPDVVRYIDALRPRDDASYVLVNAMGAGEYFGSNINGDHFPEAALIHAPDSWSGNPLLDKIKAKDWAYGYPTFYYAHPYAHHRNKDANKAFGEVELAAWNDGMKRVELVVRVDKTKCLEHGGVPVWDKLKQGMHPDVSMGCKVPYDTCSICLDWKAYRAAQATFRPGHDKHPGEAVLRYHRTVKKIRGLSITRADYCEHAKKQMNKILPDGRKVFVYNDYPRFFDISFVFIGADKTAKVMMKIASGQEKTAGQANQADGSSPEDADFDPFYGYYKTRPMRGKLGLLALLAGGKQASAAVHGPQFKPDPKVVAAAEKSMKSFLKSQGLPEDHPHAIGAGASMYFQGFRPGLKDLDVYVPGLKKDHIQVVHHGYEIDAHGDLDNLSKGFGKRVLEDRVHHGDLQLMSLPHTLEMKRLLNREKDQPDIHLLSSHLEKKAEVSDERLKMAFLGKLAKSKSGEITKDVMPSQFASKAIPVLTKGEKDLPKALLDTLARAPLSEALSTTGGMGMVLRPREFQRIILIQSGNRPLADHYEDKNIVFPKSEEKTDMALGPEFFSSILARLLLPMMEGRSALGPMIEKRALMLSGPSFEDLVAPTSLSSELLHKIGSAYNGYRSALMDLIANAQPLLKSAAKSSEAELHKLSSTDVQQMFTPLTVHYLHHAFQDEVGVCGARTWEAKVAFASAESGSHSRNASLPTR